MSTITILSIKGQVIELHCPIDVPVPRIRSIINVNDETGGSTDLQLEVQSFSKSDNGWILKTVALGSTQGLRRRQVCCLAEDRFDDGDLWQAVKGRVLDGRARIYDIDSTGEVRSSLSFHNLRQHQFSNSSVEAVNQTSALSGAEVLTTGIPVIDTFAPILKGGKTGIFGGAGVGKTTLQKQIIKSFLSESRDNRAVVFIGIGERIREAKEILNAIFPSGSNRNENVVFVFGQMDQSPAERVNAAFLGATIAERLSAQGMEVLVFVDNLYRFVQAISEVSTLLGRMPSVMGYPPTLELDLGDLLERFQSRKSGSGSITSIHCIYVPADDLSDPAVAAIKPHLNTTIILDRSLANKGHYPAIDILQSNSTVSRERNPLEEGIRKAIQEEKSLGVRYRLKLSLDEQESLRMKKLETLREVVDKYLTLQRGDAILEANVRDLLFDYANDPS